METIKLQIPCCIKVDNELEFYFVIDTMLNCGYKKIGAFWEYDKMLTDIGILTGNRIQTLANKPYKEYSYEQFLNSQFIKSKEMKKYKVIKEFDHKKVGETLELDDNSSTTVQWLDSNEFVVQSTIKDLISKEFIKEIQELNFKPGDFITGTWGDDVRKIVECKLNDSWYDFSWKQEDLNGSINDSFQHSWKLSDTKKATKDQIKNWYIQSAKERGYTKGTTIRSSDYNETQTINRDGYTINLNSNNSLRSITISSDKYNSEAFNGDYIYTDGKWTEIINPKEILKICGYEVEFNEDNTITTGCKDDITKEQLENMIKVSNFCYEHNIDLKFSQNQIYVLERGTNEVNQRVSIEKVISKLK